MGIFVNDRAWNLKKTKENYDIEQCHLKRSQEAIRMGNRNKWSSIDDFIHGDIIFDNVVLGQTTLRELQDEEDGGLFEDILVSEEKNCYTFYSYSDKINLNGSINDYSYYKDRENIREQMPDINTDVLLNKLQVVTEIDVTIDRKFVKNCPLIEELGMASPINDREAISIIENMGYVRIEIPEEKDWNVFIAMFVRNEEDSVGNKIFLSLRRFPISEELMLFFHCNILTKWKEYRTGRICILKGE